MATMTVEQGAGRARARRPSDDDRVDLSLLREVSGQGLVLDGGVSGRSSTFRWETRGRRSSSVASSALPPVASHDPVVEVRCCLVQTREKSSVIERTIKRRDRRQGRPGSLVESDAWLISVHRGAVEEPFDAGVSGVDRLRPFLRTRARPRADGHRRTGLRGPETHQVQEDDVSNNLEDHQPWTPRCTVDDAARLKGLCEARRRMVCRVEDALCRVNLGRRVVVVEARLGRPEEAEASPARRMSPAREVDPTEPCPCLEGRGDRRDRERCRRQRELRHLRSLRLGRPPSRESHRSTATRAA
jgi:hypothetical protein